MAVIWAYGSENATLRVLSDRPMLSGAGTLRAHTATMVLLGTAPGGALTVILLLSCACALPPSVGVNTAHVFPSVSFMETGMIPAGFSGSPVGSSTPGGLMTWTVKVAMQSS